MDKWTLDPEKKEEVFDTIRHDDRLVKKWASFETDVTNNPFFHPKAKRIEKLKGKTAFPEGTYRYKKEPLRVVYYPEGKTKIIYPLGAATTTQISYKKRTRGK